ncbi:MAG TPA: hypothetical protein VJZ78_04545 [Anaerolineales bacterium]|nr:hypothetical protein [Anaerolineales bacterium]
MTSGFGRKIGIYIFAVGALVGFTFAFLMTWANFELPFYFERSYFSVKSPTQEKMDLECPLVLTVIDDGSISASLPNNTDKIINLDFQGEISYMGGIERQVEFMPEVLPGETAEVEIKVDKEDRFYNVFILARFFQFPTYKTPARDGSCAIVMLPFTFLTGSQAFGVSLGIIILFMLGGLLIFFRNNRPLIGKKKRIFNAMLIMAIFIAVAVTAGILGMWLLGLILLAVIFLQTVAVFIFFGERDRANWR